jgi:hypothetical protein
VGIGLFDSFPKFVLWDCGEGFDWGCGKLFGGLGDDGYGAARTGFAFVDCCLFVDLFIVFIGDKLSDSHESIDHSSKSEVLKCRTHPS